jgi:putative endonuclease
VGNGDRRNAALGGFGERLAAAHYRARGYAVLERNWRCRAGEIDLICARGTTLVVCEVKARRGQAHGHPLEAVTAPKQRRLRRLAAAYLRQQGRRWPEVRFDVVSVLDG